MSRQKEPIGLLEAKQAAHMSKQQIELRRATEITPNFTPDLEPPKILTRKVDKETFKAIWNALGNINVIGDTDADVLAQASHFMIILVVMFSGFATMTAGIALINGIGNGSLSLITAVLDGVIVRIGLCILLAGPMDWGVWGYFWGNALAGYVSTLIGWWYYLSGAWKHRKLMIEK